MTIPRVLLGGLLAGLAALFFGCAKGKPLAPTSVVTAPIHLSVALGGPDVSAQTVAAVPQVVFHIEGPGLAAPVRGTLNPGPAVVSPNGDLNYLFALDVPGGGARLVSFELFDLATLSPVSLGAVLIDLTKPLPTDGLLVDMGSVNRNCYVLNTTSYYGGAYDFNSDNFLSYPLTIVGTHDMGVTWITGPVTVGGFVISNQYMLQEAKNTTPTQNLVAFLGNGPMVDFPTIPTLDKFFPTAFQSKRGPLKAGDVYCVKLSTMTGFAWVQCIDPGNATLYVYPKFRFRVNSNQLYYAYDRTAVDVANGCATFW